MRVPLWIGLLSVAGAAVASPAFAQEAKPAEAGADQPAAGHIDPAAYTALREASEAVKNIGPCTFTIEMRSEGLGDLRYEATMKVKLIRGKGPGTHAYQMVGDFYMGLAGNPKVNAALFEGKIGEWIDDEQKTLFSRPVRSTNTDEASKNVLNKCMTPNKAFEVMLLDAEPFKAELDSKVATSLTMERPEKVGDEECQVVKATIGSAKNASFRYIYISPLDKLPRKYVQAMGKPGTKQQIRRFELKDLNTDVKLTPSDLHLKVPEGYKVDKIDPPPPPPPPPPGTEKTKKVDPVKGKDDPKMTEEERQKRKQEEIERTRKKVPEDPNVIPGTAKPGKG